MELSKQKVFYQNLNEISFYFFIILSLIHLISGLCLANELYTKTAWLINRLLDVPFFLISLVYCFSFLKKEMLEKDIDNHFFDLISLSLGGLFSLSLIVYDLLIPNQLPF